jgi:predicted transcriptional regulator
MSTLISVRTEQERVEALDKIADRLDRPRNWVVNEAIQEYIERHAWQDEQIALGIADSDAGRTVTTEQLRERIQKRNQAAKKKKK